jgi:hypothetical protein
MMPPAACFARWHVCSVRHHLPCLWHSCNQRPALAIRHRAAPVPQASVKHHLHHYTALPVAQLATAGQIQECITRLCMELVTTI